MKSIIALFLMLTLPYYGLSQFFGMSLGYKHDISFIENWDPGPGFQFSLGAEGLESWKGNITYAARLSFLTNVPQSSTTIDNIEFQGSHTDNNMGFGKIRFKRHGISLETDIGTILPKSSFLEPYFSLGFFYDRYTTPLAYDLYEEDTCHCFDTKPSNFTQTQTAGMSTGLGLRFRVTDDFFVDLRSNYRGAFIRRNSDTPGLPITNDFDIDENGQAYVPYSESNYLDSFSFRISLVISFADMDVGFGGFGSSNKSDSNDTETDETSSSKDCEPQELKPRKR